MDDRVKLHPIFDCSECPSSRAGFDGYLWCYFVDCYPFRIRKIEPGSEGIPDSCPLPDYQGGE